jgi:hypothetical protein
MLMADGSVSIDVQLVCEVVKFSKLFHWLPFLFSFKKKLDLKTLKSSIMMFLVLMSLSPVLRTLTAATSSDSIWALAALLFILNALLADYTANVSEDEINEGYVSIYVWSFYLEYLLLRLGFHQYYLWMLLCLHPWCWPRAFQPTCLYLRSYYFQSYLSHYFQYSVVVCR